MSLLLFSSRSINLAGCIKGIILGTGLLSFWRLGLIDKLLLEHVQLTHVLDLAVNLVNFWLRQEPKKSQSSFVRPSVRPSGPSLSRALNHHYLGSLRSVLGL